MNKERILFPKYNNQAKVVSVKYISPNIRMKILQSNVFISLMKLELKLLLKLLKNILFLKYVRYFNFLSKQKTIMDLTLFFSKIALFLLWKGENQ
jgi:hypothetical protein